MKLQVCVSFVTICCMSPARRIATTGAYRHSDFPVGESARSSSMSINPASRMTGAPRSVASGGLICPRVVKPPRENVFLPTSLPATGRPATSVALGILGQLGRLEMRSKVENLIWPTQASGARVDLFFVLQQQIRKFSSKTRMENALKSLGTPCATGATPEQLQGMPFPNISVEGSDFPSEQPWNTLPKFVQRRFIDETEFPFNVGHNRGMSVREIREIQVQALTNARKLALLIETAEHRRGRMYDVVIWIRDDSIVVQPHVVQVPYLDARPEVPACYVKGCCRWGGINDKGMACSRRYMQAMLRAPHEELLWNISSPSIGRTNNENFIADHMRNHGVPVQEVSAERLPIVTGRPPCYCKTESNSRHDLWCLVDSTHKDCHPDKLPQASKFYKVSSLT